MYAADKKHKSIHVSNWPTVKEKKINNTVEKQGDMIMALISAVRREKSEKRMPLNAPIKKLMIYTGNKKDAHILNKVMKDVEGTCKVEKMEILPEKGEGKEVEEHPNVRFVAKY
jgi:valyl-tRNA synthetase